MYVKRKLLQHVNASRSTIFLFRQTLVLVLQSAVWSVFVFSMLTTDTKKKKKHAFPVCKAQQSFQRLLSANTLQSEIAAPGQQAG